MKLVSGARGLIESAPLASIISTLLGRERERNCQAENNLDTLLGKLKGYSYLL